ncbi:MAG TPA: ethanolamine ammonia-lyase subunit EutB [Pyrinomonadaceae bacterium]|jgi:ethanolamine ammonia-lyase large subunit
MAAMNQRELLQTFVLANEFKEGDALVGGGRDARVREEARAILGAWRVGDITKSLFVEDALSETLSRSLDSQLAAQIAHLSISQLKTILLSAEGAAWAQRYRDGLSSEVIAATAKLMTNAELSSLAQMIFNPLPGDGITIGSRGHFGSRIQPNSPGDDEEEILFSILEGLSYGCGDVVLGLNPASDEVEAIVRLEELLSSVVERLKLPTRYCVLSDILKQTSARQLTKVDVGFQSLAGTSRALAGMVSMDLDGILELARGFDGLYFETGQGAEVTNGAAEGLDMLTLEARTYGAARYVGRRTGAWMIVNDVAGFIGPEVFRTAEQLLRACLEDTVMAKLHGLTMGLDVCSTFHMGIEPRSLQLLTEQIVRQAAPAYLMAVAGNTDPMLGYMTTSFREHPRLRRLTRKQVSTPMRKRLAALGLMDEGGGLRAGASTPESLYATYMKAGGDARSSEELRQAGAKKMKELRERGYDLGYGYGDEFQSPPAVESRMEAIYRHAQVALRATLSEAVIADASPRHILVRTRAQGREQYLSHPPTGELICERDAKRLIRLYATRRPQVQLVLSDGLNANALNESLRALLPVLRGELSATGLHVGEVDVVIRNGRVRAGYHTGTLLDVDAIVHLIGERPGTGLNTLSAYLTYGRDARGLTRWSPHLDHSWTTAICGIHPQGKPPATAAQEITRAVRRMFEERCSGVELGRAGKDEGGRMKN